MPDLKADAATIRAHIADLKEGGGDSFDKEIASLTRLADMADRLASPAFFGTVLFFIDQNDDARDAAQAVQDYVRGE